MKKLNLLALSAVLCVAGAQAELYSNIYIINKTDKDLAIGRRTEVLYRFNDGQERNRSQVGGSMTIKKGDRVLIGKIRRDLNSFVQIGKVDFKFTVDGKEHEFQAAKHYGIATTLTYSNPSQDIKNMRLPVKGDGLEIKSKYVFGQIYHDVEMEFFPGYSY